MIPFSLPICSQSLVPPFSPLFGFLSFLSRLPLGPPFFIPILRRPQQYLATGAESMLRSEAGINWVRSIKGIWIASDDPDAVDEVREVYPRFFPNVESELIVWASAGVEGALETRRVVTHSDRQVREQAPRYPL